MRAIYSLALITSCLAWSQIGFAEKMAFPEDELARESVLPVFDVPNSVRHRNVVVAGKFEVGGFLGSVSDEAIFNQTQYGFLGTYHLNEVHGLNISYGLMGSGVGSYATTLKNSTSITNGPELAKTFGPKSYFLASYQFTGFYGKLSILKNLVVNTHIYGLAGLGTVMYDGMNSLALDFGLGQRFYILKNLALRFDLKMVRFTGPNPIVNKSKNVDLAAGKMKIGDFESTNYLLTHITGGLVFLF
jgi:outer membrane beta-barrel protein